MSLDVGGVNSRNYAGSGYGFTGVANMTLPECYNMCMLIPGISFQGHACEQGSIKHLLT